MVQRCLSKATRCLTSLRSWTGPQDQLDRISPRTEQPGLSRENLFYHENLGVVPGDRLPNSYRQYRDADLPRLRFVLELEAAGLELEDCIMCLDESIERQLLRLSKADIYRLHWLSHSYTHHEDYMDDFFTIFEGLDAHGPGTPTDTLAALALARAHGVAVARGARPRPLQERPEPEGRPHDERGGLEAREHRQQLPLHVAPRLR